MAYEPCIAPPDVYELNKRKKNKKNRKKDKSTCVLLALVPISQVLTPYSQICTSTRYQEVPMMELIRHGRGLESLRRAAALIGSIERAPVRLAALLRREVRTRYGCCSCDTCWCLGSAGYFHNWNQCSAAALVSSIESAARNPCTTVFWLQNLARNRF